MSPIVISESTTEPITLAQAVANVRATEGSPDAAAGGSISKLITAARQACEDFLEVSLVEKTLEIAQHSFNDPCPIELPLGPVREIVSVKYLDRDGNDTTLDPTRYRISPYAPTATLMRAYGTCWPEARCDIDSIRVRYTVGYPSTDSPPQTVPEPILRAMHLYIVHWYEHRSAVDDDSLMELPLGAKHLLSPRRRGLGV